MVASFVVGLWYTGEEVITLHRSHIDPDLLEPIRTMFHVDYVFEGLRDRILEFQSSLDSDSEIALWLASFGTQIVMRVERITYRDPAFICFSGLVDGRKSELIQHMNQLSFLVTVVPKENQEQPARRIGFRGPDDA